VENNPKVFKISFLCFWFVIIIASQHHSQPSSVSLTLNVPKVGPKCTDFNSKKGREQELIVKQAMDREEERRKTHRIRLFTISAQ
jgi:hypothetical protein